MQAAHRAPGGGRRPRGAPRQRQPKVSPRHATKGAGEIPPSERSSCPNGLTRPSEETSSTRSQVVFLKNARQVIRHMHHTREGDGPCAAAEWNFVGSDTSDKIAADPPRGVASE